MRKIISITVILCVILEILLLSVAGANAVSGKVGSCSWQLDGTKLTISGNGSTGFQKTSPWGTNITELIVEEGVTDLYMSMFFECTKLRSVKLPSSLKTIGASAFSGCTSLTNVEIPDGVVTIGGGAFYGCSLLVEVKIPKTVASIDYEAFEDCYNLAMIEVDEGNPYFKSVDGVLYNKNMTKLIKYPQKKVGQTYTVPDSVNAIGYKAFNGNWNLIYVYLPDNITQIGAHAFFYTSMRHNTENHFDGGFYLGNYLIGLASDKAVSLVVREGTTLIADGAFTGSDNLATVRISDGVKYIGSNAFAWCWKLSRVSIPKSVTYIGESAFYDCTVLKNIYYRGSQRDRAVMFIGGQNTSLTNAQWSYNSCLTSDQHRWGEAVVKQADCTTEGSIEKICQLCKAIDLEIIPKSEHTYTITSVTKSPTCIEAGIEEHICSVCNHVESKILPPTSHVFGEWTVHSDPTCTEMGVNKRECVLCNAMEAINTEPLGHDYGDFVVIVKPTARKQGIEQQECKKCGNIVSQNIPSLIEQGGGININIIILIVSITCVAAVFVVAIVILTNFLDRKKRKGR